MRQQEIAEALEYLYWMRDRIAAAAGGLSDAQFRSDVPSATRSLRGILAHQLECEWAWRIRLRDGAFPDGDVVAGDYPTLSSLLERWREEQEALQAWVTELADADVAATPPGTQSPLATWRYLVYVVNHGSQQFAEAATLLTALGHSPGEIGYLAFCLERLDTVR